MTKKTQTPAANAARILLRPDEFASPRREWLAEGVLLADRPAVMCGERIGLTWFAADLAVSLATGTPFLGHFTTRRRRTALCCYETEYKDVHEIAHVVAAARGADLAGSELRLPQRGVPFRTPAERRAVVAEMRNEGVEVVVLDPIRCALRTGERNEVESEAARLPDIGDAFLAAGVTPVFTHGTQRLTVSGLTGPGTLGLGDYMRQWLFVAKDGRADARGHTFRLTAGGYAGHAGAWNVRANPGLLRPDGEGLRWDVEVFGGSDLSGGPQRRDEADQREAADMLDAESDARKVANRGLRLKGEKPPRPGAQPLKAVPPAPSVFSFA